MEVERAIRLQHETVENLIDSKTGLRARRKKKRQLIGPCRVNSSQFGRTIDILSSHIMLRMKLQTQIK